MENKIKKAFISFRIGIPREMPEKRFQELLCLFEKYKGVTDEITFFTSETHPRWRYQGNWDIVGGRTSC